jgi:DNA/RNA endonuclease G (NUC1)
MRPSLWRGIFAAVSGIALLSCVDSLTAPGTKPGGGPRANDTGDPVPTPKVVISQIYGAGGNNNALLQNDYVELFNAGTAPQDLTNWSIQYTSATGTGGLGSGTNTLTLLSGTIAPGEYFLVTETGGTTGGAMPPFDIKGNIAMAAGAGKVALVSQATALGCNNTSTCSAAQLAQIIDLVGYGTGTSGANFFEGSGAAPTISTALGDFRAGHGCTDTNDNAADFAAATPAPRNSSTPLAPCGVVTPPNTGPLDTVVVTGDNSVVVGSTIKLVATLQDDAQKTITDPDATYTWSSADETIARIESTSGDTATIIGVKAGGPIGISVTAVSKGASKTTTPEVTVVPPGTIVPSTTFVSEIHYDNTGADVGEAIEIEGDANSSIEGWSLVLYNGNGGVPYNTTALSGTIPATCGSRGVVVIHFPDTPSGTIQNGPDGWALVNAHGQVTEFNSYEGPVTGTSGPATGLSATIINADESTAPVAGRSVQRAGNGVWFGPRTNTFGACNPALPLGPQGSVTVVDGKTDLAFAMQTQFFFGGTNLTGQPVTSVVWSTSNPAEITVDQHGVVTGKGVGSAQLIATAPDGATGTVDMTVYLAAGSSGIRLGHNTEFGVPKDADASDDFLIRRAQYTVSYNPRHGGANWVSWNLDASHIGDNGRCPGTCYSADTALENAHITAYTTADWVSNVNGVVGYDRGHMAPSADWTSSEADNNTTFFLSNFVPQRADLNQGPWEVLEEALRDSVSAANGSREAYIIDGGIFTNGVGLGSLLDSGKVWIPDSTWKIAVITPAGAGLNADGTLPAHTTVLAVNMPNVQGIKNNDWNDYITTVAKIEHSTGYNFLDLITESVQCRVEVRNCAPSAQITSGVNGETDEGQTVEFSGAGSTDPDPGDVLTMSWTVNGASAGSGPTLDYTFANDGLYQIGLTVTDRAGATNLAKVNVTVNNVPPQISALPGATLLRGETYRASGSFTDPGADTWTGTVNFGDGPATPSLDLTNKTFNLAHTYTTAGQFSVTVSISDGSVTSSRVAAVRVESGTEGIQDLKTRVGHLPLNAGQANSLNVKLDAASAQLQAGNPSAAVNILGAFINENQATVQSSRISSSAGSDAIAYAQRVIASIDTP